LYNIVENEYLIFDGVNVLILLITAALYL